MRLSVKTSLRWLVYLVIASAAVYLAASLVLSSDKSGQAIEKFLANNERIAAQIGSIKKIELVKKVSVSATEASNPYRLYTFAVSGSKAKATVIVRAEKSDVNGTQEQFLIDRIDPD